MYSNKNPGGAVIYESYDIEEVKCGQSYTHLSVLKLFWVASGQLRERGRSFERGRLSE